MSELKIIDEAKMRLSARLPSLKVCDHAEIRLQERFPDLDPKILYIQAKAPCSRIKKLIRKKCSFQTNSKMLYDNRYYLITPENIVLIMKHPRTLVTAFRLEE